MPVSNAFNPLRNQPTSAASPSATAPSSPTSWKPPLTKIGDMVARLMYQYGPEDMQHEMAFNRLTDCPYYPITATLEGYVKNEKTVLELLFKFGGACLLVLGTTWFALKRWRHNLPVLDKAAVLWFVLTGSLHTVFEGYFVYNHGRMPSRMDLLGQLWKEYALSDSRYLIADTFVLSIETITATVWGPLSFCTAYMIATSDPLRHSFQTIVSLAHIYGCLLYFVTSTVDSSWKGTNHSRPEFQYFWIYYFGMNFAFIAIPGFLLFQSVLEVQSAFAAHDRMRRSIRVNEKVAKVEGINRVSERKNSQ